MSSTRPFKALILTVLSALILTGCGLQPSTSLLLKLGPGSLAPVEGAAGQEIVVTSKNFTEQILLGKIAAFTAQASGFEVRDMTNVPGSQPVRKLMLSGSADLSMEYTGTAWLTYMGHEQGIPDPQQQWQAVHDEDEANGLVWGKPTPLNNQYALAVNSDFAERYGVTKLSDLSRVPVQQRTMCVEAEFNSRSDGLNPMLKTYGLERGSATGVPTSNISVMDTGTVYTATADGSPCNFGEVFTTDGRVDALNLKVLQDDRHFFPAYNAAAVINEDFLRRYPQLMDRLNQVVAAIDDSTMRKMNLRVDVEGEDPAKVVRDWMVSEGFITAP